MHFYTGRQPHLLFSKVYDEEKYAMGEKYPSREQYKQQNKRKEQTFKKRAVRVIMAILICIVFLIGGLSITAIAYVIEAPPLSPEKLIAPQSSTIYDMNDEVLFDIAGEEYRKVVPLEEVPKEVQNAFLAIEDARFWEHRGLDFKRIAGAIVKNTQEGFGSEGASTITQQLVKLSFLTPEKTIKRKVQEAYLSLKLERKYSKEEILELYLNKVYFGEGAYGLATAAEVYFGKSVNDLTMNEAAILAGLPQRPSGYNPFSEPERAESRKNTVLTLMEQRGYITKQEMQEAKLLSVDGLLKKQQKETKYRSFTDHVIEELKEKGIDEQAIYTQGLKIYTTMDPEAQEFTNKVLSTNDYLRYPDDKFKAGVALLDTKTGEIRALGGRRHTDEEEIERGFNYATQLKRQPGSTIKPIMAYAPAIEKLHWTPNQVIKDEQLVLNGKAFRNWNNRYHGSVTMRTALQWSYNIPAIKTMQAVGPEEAKAFAGKLGIELDEVYPAYAIGGFKDGISPLQLAGAFAAFGNDGMYSKPHAVRKIIYSDGREQQLQPKAVRAMKTKTAYLITDMLKDVVTQGTGTMANISGLPLAGKTGTNQLPDEIRGSGAADAWFVGYTTSYTAAVWTGYGVTTQKTYIKSQDTHLAKQLFKHIMTHISKGKETADFKRPLITGTELETRPRENRPRNTDNVEEKTEEQEKTDERKVDQEKRPQEQQRERDTRHDRNESEKPNEPKPKQPREPKPEQPKEEPPENPPVNPPEKPDEDQPESNRRNELHSN